MRAAGAPTGVVTFLFTDIEGSTRRWESDAAGMTVAEMVNYAYAQIDQARAGLEIT